MCAVGTNRGGLHGKGLQVLNRLLSVLGPTNLRSHNRAQRPAGGATSTGKGGEGAASAHGREVGDALMFQEDTWPAKQGAMPRVFESMTRERAYNDVSSAQWEPTHLREGKHGGLRAVKMQKGVALYLPRVSNKQMQR